MARTVEQNVSSHILRNWRGDHQLREDISQLVALVAFLHPPDKALHPIQQFRRLKNRVLDEMRKAGNQRLFSQDIWNRIRGPRERRRVFPEPIEPIIGRENGEGLRGVETRDEAQFYMDALARLDRKSYIVVKLYFGEDLGWERTRSIAEVVGITGIPTERVYQLITRGLRILRGIPRERHARSRHAR